MFSEDRGFLHALVASFGAPSGCEVESASVRTRVDCVKSVEEQGSAECMGHHDHNAQQSQGCHGDGGGSALVQHCLCHHCFCCCQQISHSFAAVVAADDGAADAAAVSLVSSPAGCPALIWNLQKLHFLLQQWMWHCGYELHSVGGTFLQKSYPCHNSSLFLNQWLGVLTGAEAEFVEMSVGAVVEDGDEQPEEQDLLGLVKGAESRTHRHHQLPLGISESPLLTWKYQPLF